jgi:hypothetical protein
MAEQDGQTAEQGGHTAPPGAGRGGRFLRRASLLLTVVALGCWVGGWVRASSDHGLTAAQADQTTIRLTLDGFPLGQYNGCDELNYTQAALQIPLHNYSPGPVAIQSIAVDPPGQAPEAAQKTGVTIGAHSSAQVEALIPVQLCTADHGDDECPKAERELDATFTVIPDSGRVHEVTLPIAEWVPTRFLQLSEDAPFADWGGTTTCS